MVDMRRGGSIKKDGRRLRARSHAASLPDAIPLRPMQQCPQKTCPVPGETNFERLVW